MKGIAIFYHALFAIGDGEVLPGAIDIVSEQMQILQSSGLLQSANHLTIGINGGDESRVYCESLLPLQADVVMHGLKCRNECRTIMEIEKFVKDHPDWAVLYFHAKGCTHPPGDEYRKRWRNCMMIQCVSNWRRCLKDLQHYESVGCHWRCPPFTPGRQYIWAGNFFWARSDFLRTLPSILDCGRVRTGQSALDDMDTRFEAEVWIGNGPRPPKVKDYHPGWSAGIHGH